MKKYILLFLSIILLSGCQTVNFLTLEGRRNCMVNAIGFQDAYNADKKFDPYRWSQVLAVFIENKKLGHAICVYQYKNRIMVYDNERGSWTLTKDLTLKDKPEELAKLWMPSAKFKYAAYYE
jgi:putative VirB-like lipoprotein